MNPITGMKKRNLIHGDLRLNRCSMPWKNCPKATGWCFPCSCLKGTTTVRLRRSWVYRNQLPNHSTPGHDRKYSKFLYKKAMEDRFERFIKENREGFDFRDPD